MAFYLEMVHHRKLDFFRVSFMTAGHTKFFVDRLFPNIAQIFTRSDVLNFATQDLGNIAHQYATSVVINESDGISYSIQFGGVPFRSTCTEMPGIHSLHDCHIICAHRPSTGDAMMCVRKLCYEGPMEDSSIKLANGHSTSDVTIPEPEFTYKS